VHLNAERYDWHCASLAGVHHGGYQLAHDVAKRVERAYRWEVGVKDSRFIGFGYWDSAHAGLLAGELLQHDLHRLEVAYGLRPTPQNTLQLSGETGQARLRARHREVETTPGSSSCKPAKKRAICSGLRRVYGVAALARDTRAVPRTGKSSAERVVRLHDNHDSDLVDITVQGADKRTATLHITWLDASTIARHDA